MVSYCTCSTVGYFAFSASTVIFVLGLMIVPVRTTMRLPAVAVAPSWVATALSASAQVLVARPSVPLVMGAFRRSLSYSDSTELLMRALMLPLPTLGLWFRPKRGLPFTWMGRPSRVFTRMLA